MLKRFKAQKYMGLDNGKQQIFKMAPSISNKSGQSNKQGLSKTGSYATHHI